MRKISLLIAVLGMLSGSVGWARVAVPMSAAERGQALLCVALVKSQLPTIAARMPAEQRRLRVIYARWGWRVANADGVDAADVVHGDLSAKLQLVAAMTAEDRQLALARCAGGPRVG